MTAQIAEGAFEFRNTDRIGNVDVHEDCKEYQGDEITLLKCNEAFELYSTLMLAQDPYELTDYGETKALRGVGRSFEQGKTGHLTYVQDRTTVRRAYVDSEGDIVKSTIMNLAMTEFEIVEDLYVLDKIVAVRFQNTQNAALFRFRFFEKPLRAGDYGMPITFSGENLLSDGTADINPSALAYGMSLERSEAYFDANLYGNYTTYDRLVELYAVSPGLFERYIFQWVESSRTLTMEVQTKEVPEFDGTYMAMANALDAIVVSCSDCSKPRVDLF